LGDENYGRYQVDGAAGIHEDENGQPFALITASSSLDTRSLTASHEAFEMLVDPFGNRVIAGDSPKPDQGRASFLVEVCDPSEAADYAYSVNGILVSDFYTPNYFDPVTSPGVRYSFTGALTEPRQVLPGGYLSWQDAASGHWGQEVWFGTDQPVFRDLGVIDQRANGNVRAVIDRSTMGGTMKAIARGNQIGSCRNHGGGDLAICRHPCGHVARANQRDSRRRAEGLRGPSRDRAAGCSTNPKMRS
jgi:hypothetical protein